MPKISRVFAKSNALLRGCRDLTRSLRRAAAICTQAATHSCHHPTSADSGYPTARSAPSKDSLRPAQEHRIGKENRPPTIPNHVVATDSPPNIPCPLACNQLIQIRAIRIVHQDRRGPREHIVCADAVDGQVADGDLCRVLTYLYDDAAVARRLSASAGFRSAAPTQSPAVTP